MTYQELREEAGRCQVALDAFELDNGTKPKLATMAEHNRLLRANEDAKKALRIHEAQVTGQMNFQPKLTTK